MSPKKYKNTILNAENAHEIEALQKMDKELKAVLTSLSPSLEALATLGPQDQVKKMKDLMLELKTKAGKLADENEQIKDIVNKFQGRMNSPLDGIENANYVMFLYENKILGGRLKRILDPNCNKRIQCGIIDRHLCRHSQTNDMDQVLRDYIIGKERERRKQLSDAKTLKAGTFIPGNIRAVDSDNCDCYFDEHFIGDPPMFKTVFQMTLVCAGIIFVSVLTLALLIQFYVNTGLEA